MVYVGFCVEYRVPRYVEIGMISWYIVFSVEYRLSRKFYGTMVNRIIVWNIVCLETSMVSCTYTAVQIW